ncbi:MAG: hypothetical protein ABIG03_02250 [Candidatus Eisenbacteria bacterium]
MDRPPDRHKWFFNTAEASGFLRAKAEEFGVEIEDLFVTERPRSLFLRFLRRLRYPGAGYQNRYACTVWAVLRKPL